MGRKSFKSRKGKSKGGSDRSSNQKNYAETIKDNDSFKQYYKNQNILPDDAEFDEFYRVLKTTLPTTFRVTGTRSNALQLREVVQNVLVPSMQSIEVDGQIYEPPMPIPWYPDNFGWQVNAPRSVLRKSQEFSSFQKFIVSETEAGNISRQEAVSMVPPLLMDIKPHMWVLDMCAAPGSKTAQIIEAVHANDLLNELPTGLVVANDADYKRSHMLVHQSKRLQSPCFIATNHYGQQIPAMHVKDENGKLAAWQFDRVLCDVPCSGDGTLRKNETIWNDWSQNQALGLHRTQVQIFLRGAQLTKVGGRIVYSTCSFNPVENEAVVAEVLRLTDGALEIKDMSHELPELKRKPGLTNWKVMTKDGEYITSLDDIKGDRQRSKFPASVFPPENVESLHLDRCLRIYPHQQNTGGFFVAVFDKVKPLTAADRVHEGKSDLDAHEMQQSEANEEKLVEAVGGGQEGEDQQQAVSATAEPSAAEGNASETPGSKRPAEDVSSSTNNIAQQQPAVKKQKQDVPQIKEAPFQLMSPDNPDVNALTEYFGIDPAFPRDQFILRCEEEAKNRTIYFCSKSVRSILQSKDWDKLHVVNTGVRLFVRQGSLGDESLAAPFRLTSDGLPLLERVMVDDRRKIKISDEAQEEDLKTLLMAPDMPRVEELSASTQEKMQKLGVGSCIFEFDVAKAFNKPLDKTLSLSLPVWKGKNRVNLLINKHDKRSLCQRIFGVTGSSDAAASKPVVAAPSSSNDDADQVKSSDQQPEQKQ
ncbi:S-adenosyl-L-methionine-dependent methyltransferase [Zychaea mexicana]|uniref:S-adenosyl-L-methionine-dependent methyltransferase n=1 Tax=Zychaea mexicana TaxID=64656 RepID=UPI0022FEEFCA|nr:S-adenosyl-L-methionine-dependent methyltransferase [Zychaea mexicana]KAI9495549.1 S-adenosyl-L-methionine-dependent methyltransferase [Zychaea mexicana]